MLITAHGNSLRALVKHLDEISEKDILAVNIPTAVPLVYDIDRETLKPVACEASDEFEFSSKGLGDFLRRRPSFALCAVLLLSGDLLFGENIVQPDRANLTSKPHISKH